VRLPAGVDAFVDHHGQLDIFLAALAAALADLLQLKFCEVETPRLHIAFAEIFTRQHEIRVDGEGRLVIADRGREVAALAVAVSQIIQHMRVALVCSVQNGDGFGIVSGLGQQSPLRVELVIQIELRVFPFLALVAAGTPPAVTLGLTGIPGLFCRAGWRFGRRSAATEGVCGGRLHE